MQDNLPPSQAYLHAARHIIVVGIAGSRSFRNKDSPCSRLREPAALHALCVCVCVCAGDTTKPFGSLCWCFTTDGRTDGREEEWEGRETSSCILHLASYGLCVRVVDCAVCCCMGFQKGSRESGWGRGGDEGIRDRLTYTHTVLEARDGTTETPLSFPSDPFRTETRSRSVCCCSCKCWSPVGGWHVPTYTVVSSRSAKIIIRLSCDAVRPTRRDDGDLIVFAVATGDDRTPIGTRCLL